MFALDPKAGARFQKVPDLWLYQAAITGPAALVGFIGMGMAEERQLKYIFQAVVFWAGALFHATKSHKRYY